MPWGGIFASGASVTVITDPGTTIAVTSVAGEPLKPGIAIDAFGTAAAGQALTATVASTIEMRGAAAPDPALRRNGFGIRAFSFLDAPIIVDYIGPRITTQGGNGIGIAALSGGGGIAINSFGTITTTGSGAFGIFANNTNLIASFPSEFKATPVFNGVPIGTTEVNATTVTTTGEFSTGIVANGTGKVAVNVLPGGSVSGGWQAGLTRRRFKSWRPRQHVYEQRHVGVVGGRGAHNARQYGQFLPPGSTGNAMALNGPVQGQILGTTTFINSDPKPRFMRPFLRSLCSMAARFSIPCMSGSVRRSICDAGRSLRAAYNNGTWGRVIAQHGNREGDDIGIFGAGPRYDYDFGAFQIGQDFYRSSSRTAGVRTPASMLPSVAPTVMLSISLASAPATTPLWPTRRVVIGPPSVPAGWYLDSVVQATFYDIDGDSNRLPALHTEGWGLGGSLEGGAPFKFGGGWQIEPQAQLIFQTININQGSDVGATVRFQDVDSLAGRVGVRLANTWMMPSMLGMSQPMLVTGWFRPNLWHEFLGDPKTLFSSETGFIPFRADLGGSWVELNGGISAQINRTTSLYANTSYQIGLDGDSTAWDAKVGLKFNW